MTSRLASAMPRFSGLRLFEIGGYALQVFLVEAVPRLGVPGRPRTSRRDSPRPFHVRHAVNQLPDRVPAHRTRRVSGGDRPGTTMFVPNYGPQRKS
jgi:hypothetical protein